MKAKELRDLSIEELKTKTQDLRKELFDHQFKHGTRQLTDTAVLNRTKRDIARAETVLAEKQRAEASA